MTVVTNYPTTNLAAPTGAQIAASTTPAAFTAWPLSARASFVQQNGTGTPPQVLIGAFGGDQIVASLMSDGTVDTASVPTSFSTAASQLDAATFSSWPAEVQAFYVKQNGSGGSVTIGTGTGQTTATLEPGGLSVSDGSSMTVYVPPPDSPTKLGACYIAPTDLTPALFSSWPPDAQKAYLLKVAGSTPAYPIAIVFAIQYQGDPSEYSDGYSATLNSATSDVSFSANPSGFAAEMDGGDLTPNRVDVQTFLGWPQNAQIAYFRYLTERTGAATGADPGPDQTLYYSDSSNYVTVAANGDGSGLSFTFNSPDDSDPTQFALLSATDQTSYFNTKASGTPPSFLIGAGSTLLTLGPTGSVVAQICPAGFTSAPASLTPQMVQSWTIEARKAYAGQHGGGVMIGANGTLTATIDSSGTVAVQTPIPYENPPGVTSQVVKDTANLLFPVTVLSPSRASPSALDPATFEGWTSAQQVAYIQANLNGASSISIAGTSASGASPIDVFLGTAASSTLLPPVYTVQNLQKSDIAKMAFADQKTLAAIPAFQAIASGLGLIPADGTDATATVNGLIETAREQILAESGLPPQAKAIFTAEIDLIRANLLGSAVPQPGSKDYGDNYDVDPTPLTSATQTGGSAIFSPTDIQNALTAITKRADRANAFATVAVYNNNVISPNYTNTSVTISGLIYTYPLTSAVINNKTYKSPPYIFNITDPSGKIDASPALTVGQYGQPENSIQTFDNQNISISVYSSDNPVAVATDTITSYAYGPAPTNPTALDNNAASINGYVNFMTQETAIMNNVYNAQSLASTRKLTGSNQNLDLPDLICLYQIYNNNTEQAIIAADTEEVNQANDILKDYAAMQQIVNATAGKATSTASDPLLVQLGSQSATILAMFSTPSNNAPPNESPIEKYYLGSLLRPTKSGLSKSSTDTSANWTQFGTELGDAVTQLNQGSQIKMNDLTSETKQQDRYFDLASTALSKLNETLTQIASSS